MEKILISGVNVFIDLLEIGLLDELFHIDCEVYTTDYVKLELLREAQKDSVLRFEQKGVLHVAAFDFDEVIKIDTIYRHYKNKTNLSMADCSVWYYAKQNNYTVLTEDGKIHISALNEGVKVRGIRIS